MQPSQSTETVLSAAIRLLAELPGLVGEAVIAHLAPQLERLISQMQVSQDETQRQQLAYELVDVLVAQPETRRLFRQYQAEAALTSIPSLSGDLDAQLAAISAQIGADQGAAPDILAYASRYLKAPGLPAAPEQRLVYLEQGGVGKAKTVKVKNFRLDIDQLSELAPGIIITAAEKVLPAANPLLVAAGVLLIVRSLVKAMTFEISEQEASVFWGLIQASNLERIASEEAIVKMTNAERQKVGLEALKPNQVKASLYRLQAIETVQAQKEPAGHWKIVENYQVRKTTPR